MVEEFSMQKDGKSFIAEKLTEQEVNQLADKATEIVSLFEGMSPTHILITLSICEKAVKRRFGVTSYTIKEYHKEKS